MNNIIRILLLVLLGLHLSFDKAQATVMADTLEAGNYYRLGAKLAKENKLDSARYFMTRAAIGFAAANYWDRYFYAVYQVGYLYNYDRKYDRALSFTDSVLNVNGDKFDEMFKSYLYLNGAIGHANLVLSHIEKAEEYLLKILRVLDTNPYVTDDNRLWVYYNFGRVYFHSNQYDLSLSYLDKCQLIAEPLHKEVYLSYCYNLKGIISRRVGEYERALKYYKQAMMQLKDKPDIQKLQFFNNIGRLYHNLGNDDEALSYFDRGLQALWDFTDDYYSIESSLINNKVLVFIDNGNFDLARELLDKVYKRELEYYGKLTIQSANTLLSYGDMELKMKQYEKAQGHFIQVLSIAKDTYGPNSVKLIELYRKISNCFAGQNKFEAALMQIQQGLALAFSDFNPADIYRNPDMDENMRERLELLKTLNLKSEVFFKWYYNTPDQRFLNAALETNSASLDLFHQIRENLYYGESQKVLTGLMKPLFEQAIALHMMAIDSLDDQDPDVHYDAIFAAMEGSKAFSLSSALQRTQVWGYSVVPDSLKTMEMEYFSKMDRYEKQICDLTVSSPGDSAGVKELEQKLFETRLAFEKFRDRLTDLYPDYVHARYVSVLKGVKEAQSLLQGNELMIMYFAGEKRLYSMGLNRSSVHVADLGDREAIGHEVREFINISVKTDPAAYQQRAYDLQHQLLRPVHPNFNTKESIIIIPDDVLGYLPFDALVYELTDKPTFNNLKYEILNHTISRHYLASLYLQPGKAQQEPDDSFIGFAPDFRGEQSVLLASRSAVDSLSASMLTPLPFAQEEVQKISELIDGSALIGEMATESQFKQDAKKYKYLHVASHAMVNEKDPLYSRLIFAPENDENSGEDGMLHTYELYHMKLNNNLVTLSACRTGTGTYQKGEGIISLARGFIYAGASGVLMSLWEVADRSTSELMYYFYDELSGGSSRSQALRKAKLRYLSNADAYTSNPYYWAGFAYLGRSQEKPGHQNILFTVGIISFLFIISGLLYYRRRPS